MSSRVIRSAAPVVSAPPSYEEAIAEDFEPQKKKSTNARVDSSSRSGSSSSSNSSVSKASGRPVLEPAPSISSFHAQHMILPQSSGIPSSGAFVPQSFGSQGQPLVQSNMVVYAQPVAYGSLPTNAIQSTSYGNSSNPPIQVIQPTSKGKRSSKKGKQKSCVIS
eukprot:TRINITY_DN1437_c0_g1_i1.p1 TRINITY_DN1437_c0_g1~~TRINITY_DN1437_c0_g1_i1.p1  ORF type:complete len:164 (+),score=21.66 TRINITY_DN1437_c0_g1_i1:73-564(+)